MTTEEPSTRGDDTPGHLDLSQVTLTQLDPCVGDTFATDQDGLRFRLAEVTSIGSNVDQETGKPFSCVFCGPPSPLLDQGIYSLRHESLGALELFLVPISQHADEVRYEAVFT